MKDNNKEKKNEESKSKEDYKQLTEEEYEKMILQYKKIKYSKYL